jgi:phosphatidylglycerol:prolipoprotein diacylglycerol transferase
MYPELFRFLGISFIRSYGVMLAVAFLIGIIWARKRAARAGIPPDHVIDISFIVLISSIVGSRFFYVIFHLDEFADNLFDIVNPFQGGTVGIFGLSMGGGIVLAIISAFLFLIIKRLKPWGIFDAMMPMFALGVGITRIGCFLNGCCYGLPTDSRLGVIFPPDSGAGFHFPDTPLLPVQLYSSLAGFAILLIVLWSERFKKFDGHSFWLTIALYAVWRFVIDFYRYYEDSMIFAAIGGQQFSQNQFLSLLLFIGSVAGYVIMCSKYRSRAEVHDKPRHL